MYYHNEILYSYFIRITYFVVQMYFIGFNILLNIILNVRANKIREGSRVKHRIAHQRLILKKNIKKNETKLLLYPTALNLRGTSDSATGWVGLPVMLFVQH